jgi:hypothetical protein
VSTAAERDHAFRWFDRAYLQRDAGMLWIKYDPRFAAIVAKMGVFE